MTEQRFQDHLYYFIQDATMDEDLDGQKVTYVRSFADMEIMTNNKGLVIELEDGSEFQLTIVRSK
jgi:hypothetical protein